MFLADLRGKDTYKVEKENLLERESEIPPIFRQSPRRKSKKSELDFKNRNPILTFPEIRHRKDRPYRKIIIWEDFLAFPWIVALYPTCRLSRSSSRYEEKNFHAKVQIVVCETRSRKNRVPGSDSRWNYNVYPLSVNFWWQVQLSVGRCCRVSRTSTRRRAVIGSDILHALRLSYYF